MARYAKGYIPTPPDRVGLGHPHHLMSAAPLPASASVPLGPVQNQGNAGSCVGNSVATAVQAAAGQPFGELPARRYVYAMARAKGFGQPLTDDGAIIADAIESLAEVGYPPESAMPYTDDPIAINQMPNFESIREAVDQAPIMVTGAYRITSTGSARVRDVATAIAAGHVVVWGTELDEAFEELGPNDVWPGVTGAVIGGHAMDLAKYRTNAASKFEFSSRSSWTEDFADNGSAWVSQDAIASSHASDFWVIAVSKKLAAEVA